MDDYTFKICLVGGDAVCLEHCDDALIEMLMEQFKSLETDEYFEQDYGYGRYLCIPVRNILYIDTYPAVLNP